MKLLFLFLSTVSILNGIWVLATSHLQFAPSQDAIHRLSSVAKDKGASADAVLLRAVEDGVTYHYQQMKRKKVLASDFAGISLATGIVGLLGVTVWRRREQLAGVPVC